MSAMDLQTTLVWLAKASYFLAAVLFILGIKRMSSPVTARKGIVWAGVGMVIATLATFAITARSQPRLHRRRDRARRDPDLAAGARRSR